MTYLVISSHLDPQDIELFDGDMVILDDDLRQTEMILYISAELEDARQFAEACAFAPRTTLVESVNEELSFIAHLQYTHNNASN